VEEILEVQEERPNKFWQGIKNQGPARHLDSIVKQSIIFQINILLLMLS